jgi:hypothetical protein
VCKHPRRNGEDVGGPLLFLISKLIFTMQPPPRKSQDADIDTTPLKPFPKLVLSLHLKGSPSSMQQQQEVITTTCSANGSCNEALTNSN